MKKKGKSLEIKSIALLYEDLKSRRSNWVTTWRKLADNFDSMGYRDDEKTTLEVNDLINKKIVDTTGIQAAKTLASGMQGGMTSPARPWFGLRTQGYGFGKNASEEAYLDEITEMMRIIFQRSNFYKTMFQAYQQLSVFGTTCVIEEADLSGFRFQCLPVGTYVMDVDFYGKVDTIIRKTFMSMRQLVEEFGEDKLPESLKIIHDNYKDRAIKNSNYHTEKYPVFHAVIPNANKVIGSYKPKERAYYSVWYMEYHDTKREDYCIMHESGYDSMPFFGVRWDVVPGEVYGKSPALDILGTNKLLQQVVADTIEGMHKQVDPPVTVIASMEAINIDTSAGAVNFLQNTMGGNGASVTPTMQVGTDVKAAMMYIQQIQNEIKVGMYNDLFRMLMDSNRSQITATEISSKEQEKLILIGPVLERLQDELFNPLIERTYILMEKYDALPAMPESLQESGIKVEFVSTLAQGQKIVSTGSIQQLVAFVGNVAQMKQEALDKLNTDEVIERYSEYLGTDSALLLTSDQVGAIRGQRAQQMQEAQQQQAIAQMAQTAQAMGNTPMGNENNPNALDAVIGGLGGL